MSQDDKLIFAEEVESSSADTEWPWKVMIVDDEKAVHEVTLMA